MPITLKTPREIDHVSDAGRVLSRVLDRLVVAAVPGVTTRLLGDLAERLIIDEGAESVLKGYTTGPHRPPFPGAVCLCVNEEVVHAPPSARRLRDGDILTIDLSLRYRGWCADAARSVVVGAAATDDHARLARVTAECLAGVAACMTPGVRWSDVAALAREHAAREGLRCVGRYVGHGIGRSLHEAPRLPILDDEVAAWVRDAGDLVLRPGMVLTIEPILTPGDGRTVELADGWTVVMADGSPAAHEERTLAIVPGRCFDLTSGDGVQATPENSTGV